MLRAPLPTTLNYYLAIHSNDSFWTVQKDQASLSAVLPTTPRRPVQTGRLRLNSEVARTGACQATTPPRRPLQSDNPLYYLKIPSFGCSPCVPYAYQPDVPLLLANSTWSPPALKTIGRRVLRLGDRPKARRCPKSSHQGGTAGQHSEASSKIALI